MIIELRKYNQIRELLIGNRATGSQAQVSYWDRVQEATVTMAVVCMGVKEMRMRTGYRGTCNQPLSQGQDQGRVWTLWND